MGGLGGFYQAWLAAVLEDPMWEKPFWISVIAAVMAWLPIVPPLKTYKRLSKGRGYTTTLRPARPPCSLALVHVVDSPCG